MKRRPAKTVLEHCVVRLGFRRGSRCAYFISWWVLAVAQLDGKPTNDQVAEWWKESEGGKRTMYERLAEFRHAFPELGPAATPADLVPEVIERTRARRKELDELRPEQLLSELLALPVWGGVDAGA